MQTHITIGFQDERGRTAPAVLYAGDSREAARNAQDEASDYPLVLSGVLSVQRRRVNEVSEKPAPAPKPKKRK